MSGKPLGSPNLSARGFSHMTGFFLAFTVPQFDTEYCEIKSEIDRWTIRAGYALEAGLFSVIRRKRHVKQKRKVASHGLNSRRQKLPEREG
jgi:hypothetical protein